MVTAETTLKQPEMRFGADAPLYAFTTENLGEYYGRLIRPGDSVLSVCGSGDQIVHAALAGAARIEAFDINQAALALAELKLAALQRLSFTEFIRFFLRYSPGTKKSNRLAFDLAVYNELRSALCPQSANFFDRQYAQGSGCGEQLRQSELFNNRYDTNELKIKCNPYLKNPQRYEAARKAAQSVPVTFTHCSVFSLTNLLAPKRFDRIMLSNISDYAHLWSGSKSGALDWYFRIAVRPILALCNPGGSVAAAYVYDTGGSVRTEIDSPQARQRIIGKHFPRFKELSFPGVVNGCTDRVIIIEEESYET